MIKEDNTKVIEAGMAFNIRLTLTNFVTDKKDAGKDTNIRNCLLIADTILVTATGAETLTQGVSRSFNDVSYNLEDDENVAEEQSTAQNSQLNARKKEQSK